MLLPSVVVAESSIHGQGLFATELIRCGCVVWHPCRNCEVWYPEQLVYLPVERIDYLDEYGYKLMHGGILIPCSNAHLMNHSCCSAVLDFGLDFGIAIRDIAPGEEVTCDYRTFTSDLPWHFNCTCGASDCVGEVFPAQGLSTSLKRRWIEQLVGAIHMISEISQPLEKSLMDCSLTYRQLKHYQGNYPFDESVSIRNPGFLAGQLGRRINGNSEF